MVKCHRLNVTATTRKASIISNAFTSNMAVLESQFIKLCKLLTTFHTVKRSIKIASQCCYP